jgi:hypothetical protein
VSADHLPDDVRRWPRDPYQLLGVNAQSDATEVRRAYSGLIRRFKPEHAPEQFRLIREAYDSVRRQLEYRRLAAADGQLENLDATPSGQAVQEAAAGDNHLQIVWDMACNGREQEAYRELQALAQAAPDDSEPPALLYCLLLANPELDPAREPCDWLVAGMRNSDSRSLCRQFYRREILDRPEEALSDRFLRLLEGPVPIPRLVELLEWRWQAAQQIDQLDIITPDLNRLGRRIEREDAEAWMRLLLRAVDYLAWFRERSADELCELIESRVDMHNRMGEEIFRIDFLRAMAAGRPGALRGGSGHRPWWEILPFSWTNPYENRNRILPHLLKWANDPESALEELDEINSRAPFVIVHLGQTLGWLAFAAPRAHEIKDLGTLFATYFDGVRHPVSEPDYFLFRWYALRFCIAEFISPETLSSIFSPRQETYLSQRLLDDWPLRLVCLAHRYAWA